MVPMSCYGAKELAESYRTVRGNTIKIAEDIPEDKYSFQAAPGTRSVAQTLVHIAHSTRFPELIHKTEKRTTLEGLNFPELFGQMAAEEQKPRTKAEIIELLRNNGDAFASFLEGLSDDFLAERVTMMMPQGASKTRFEMLLGTKEHEMHHRGQLMLIERILGITPHLTRAMNERMAQAQQQPQAATAR